MFKLCVLCFRVIRSPIAEEIIPKIICEAAMSISCRNESLSDIHSKIMKYGIGESAVTVVLSYADGGREMCLICARI